MGPHVFAVCFVLFSFVAEGSCSQPTFIQTDHDLVLHVPKSHRNINIFYWKVNKTKNIIILNGGQTFLSPTYKDRVQFFAQNLSLILKNVTLADSGLYTAVLSGVEDETLATFDVTVEDPVSAVSLRLDSVSNSSDSCNFTAICKTELFNISRSFTCDTHGCEDPNLQPAKSSPSLRLYLSEQSIVCNHSNHVNWTQDTKDVPQECKKHGEKPQAENYLSVGVGVGVGVGVVLLFVVIVIVFIFKQRRVNTENSVYDVPQDVEAPGTGMALEESPSSMYSLVGPHTAPVQKPTPVPVQNPESLYATVEKKPRTQS